MGQSGFSDLYSVFLKTTYDMRIGNREISENEVIAIFDQIQVSGLQEAMKVISARGGYGNPGHVYWENPKDLSLVFQQGVFNKNQFALMTNSQMFEIGESYIDLTYSEVLESNENHLLELKYTPIDKDNTQVYNSNGERIFNFYLNGKVITVDTPYMTVTVNYVFRYQNGGHVYKIGAPLTNGFLSLEGRTRVKDDETGQVVTGIIKIPKLKLLSDFSIRLGGQSNPVVGKLNAVGVPVGLKDKYVCEFYVLNDDIDSDI